MDAELRASARAAYALSHEPSLQFLNTSWKREGGKKARLLEVLFCALHDCG